MDVDAFFRDAIREQDDVTLSSSHPHGGNAINEDSRHGVVDLDCRVHGTTNVLVTDASTFPSCIRVNAQWTTRSEEHTSELQSLMRISYAVFCLKKKIQTLTTSTHQQALRKFKNMNSTNKK